MVAFEPKYDAAQREAIVHAYSELGIRPAHHVVRLAAHGELPLVRGRRVAPFAIPEDTVRSMTREYRRKRAGLVRSRLLGEEPRDALELLRRRLVNATDATLTDYEKAPPEHRDLRQLIHVARALREIAALPGPCDPTPPAPGAKLNGVRYGSETRSGFAGQILAAHRATQ